MKIIIDKLNKYFEEDIINELITKLDKKQRANIINDKYFAKVGKNTSELFFNNLIKEINIYQNNKDNINLPKIIDSYIDDNYVLIILERIPGKTIGINRNKFNLRLSKDKRLNIINSILNIKNINIKDTLDNDYNREERLDKYLELSKRYISKNIYNKILSLKNIIIKEKYERVISHGDLISTNIIFNNDKVYFIDWEFISYKPKYYDLIYFLLFSKTNNSIDILDDINIDILETLKDGIILCLKEIQNNAKLYNKIDNSIVDKNINRWKKELNNILRRF